MFSPSRPALALEALAALSSLLLAQNTAAKTLAWIRCQEPIPLRGKGQPPRCTASDCLAHA